MSAAVTRKFDPAERRAAARRTALILAAVAVAMFVGFILHVIWH